MKNAKKEEKLEKILKRMTGCESCRFYNTGYEGDSDRYHCAENGPCGEKMESWKINWDLLDD